MEAASSVGAESPAVDCWASDFGSDAVVPDEQAAKANTMARANRIAVIFFIMMFSFSLFFSIIAGISPENKPYSDTKLTLVDGFQFMMYH